MIYHYPVLVKIENDEYFVYFCFDKKYSDALAKDYVPEETYADSLDDAFKNARYALAEYLYKKEEAGDTDIPEQLFTDEVEIPDGMVYCRLTVDTDWYRRKYVDKEGKANPSLGEPPCKITEKDAG